MVKKSGLSVAACLGLGASAAFGQNLLNDPGFEGSSLIQAGGVLRDTLAQNPGRWVTENGERVTGPHDGIATAEGSWMLRMVNSDVVGGVTRTYQAVDVSGYAALIDSGRGSVRGSEMFASPIAGAVAEISMWCVADFASFDSSNAPTQFGSLNLGVNSSNWQGLIVEGSIPVATRWVVFSVGYQYDFVRPGIGYADANNVLVGPTPGSAMALGLGALVAVRRRRC